MNLLAFIGFGLQLVGLSLWAGGLMYHLAIASPLANRELGNRVLSADYLSSCLHRFHSWEAICGLLNLCGAGFLYVAPVASNLLWLDIGLVLVMFLVFVTYAGLIMPRIDTLRIELHDAEAYPREAEPAAFQRFLGLTTWYHRLMFLNVALSLVLLLVLTGLAMHCTNVAEGAAFDASMFGGVMNQWP